MASDISIRDDIYNNIVTSLQEITTANGYLTEPQYIEDDKFDLPQNLPTSSFPALVVIDTDEAKTQEPAKETQCRLQFLIGGYVRAIEGGDNAKTQLRKLLVDVEKALTVDPRRGYHAIHTAIDDVKTDKGMLAPYAIFDMTVTVIYSYQYGDPQN